MATGLRCVRLDSYHVSLHSFGWAVVAAPETTILALPPTI